MKDETDKPDKRLSKGFKFEFYEKLLLKELCKTSLKMSGVAAAADWVTLTFCMIAGTLLYTYTGASTVTIAVAAFVFFPLCARAQRGFENLTHDASHFNLERSVKRTNDFVGDWFCARWVFISVKTYRQTHNEHHAHFGTDADPDKKRFERLGLDRMPRNSAVRLLVFTLKTMPIYVLDYWKQFTGQKIVFIQSLALHAALVAVVSLTMMPNFWIVWLVFWWLPFLIYLPVLRFFAEAEEHRYESAASEYAATYSNVGQFQKWYLHAHGDGFHLAHHLCPQIPHWRLATAHLALSAMDDYFRAAMTRETVFDNPTAPQPSGAAAIKVKSKGV